MLRRLIIFASLFQCKISKYHAIFKFVFKRTFRLPDNVQSIAHDVPLRSNFPCAVKKKKKYAQARSAGQQRDSCGPYTINLHRKEPVAYKRRRLILRVGKIRGERARRGEGGPGKMEDVGYFHDSSSLAARDTFFSLIRHELQSYF